MAYNPAPSHWLASWASDGTTISVPIATFPELTSGEAHATTGDIRKVIYALMSKLYAAQQAEAAADRPVQMQITKGQSLSGDGTQMNVSYHVALTLAISSADVAAEP